MKRVFLALLLILGMATGSQAGYMLTWDIDYLSHTDYTTMSNTPFTASRSMSFYLPSEPALSRLAYGQTSSTHRHEGYKYYGVDIPYNAGLLYNVGPGVHASEGGLFSIAAFEEFASGDTWVNIRFESWGQSGVWPDVISGREIMMGERYDTASYQAGVEYGDLFSYLSVGDVFYGSEGEYETNGVSYTPGSGAYFFNATLSSIDEVPDGVVPEPSTFLLIAVGLVGLVGMRKKFA